MSEAFFIKSSSRSPVDSEVPFSVSLGGSSRYDHEMGFDLLTEYLFWDRLKSSVVIDRSHKSSTGYHGRIPEYRPEGRQDLILWQYVLQAYNFVVFLILVEVADYSLNYGHRRFVDAYLVVPKKIFQPATFHR